MHSCTNGYLCFFRDAGISRRNTQSCKQEIEATCPSLRTVFGFHATLAPQLLSKPCEGSSTLNRPDTSGRSPNQSRKLMLAIPAEPLPVCVEACRCAGSWAPFCRTGTTSTCAGAASAPTGSSASVHGVRARGTQFVPGARRPCPGHGVQARSTDSVQGERTPCPGHGIRGFRTRHGLRAGRNALQAALPHRQKCLIGKHGFRAVMPHRQKCPRHVCPAGGDVRQKSCLGSNAVHATIVFLALAACSAKPFG